MDSLRASSERSAYRDTVLILTNAEDAHTDVVCAALKNKRVPFIRFDTETFPETSSITFGYHRQQFTGALECPQGSIDLDRVRTVWYRRPEAARVPPGLLDVDTQFAIEESQELLQGLFAALWDRFWVNPFGLSRKGRLKPFQLALAQRLGFEVPRTLITNRPEFLAPFVGECQDSAIYKPLRHHMRTINGTDMAIYTNRLTPEHVARASGLKHAPGIFQEYIPKRVELRITVIGAKVFAAEIHSQESARSRDDWRRYDLINTPYLPHQLPKRVEQLCLDLVRELGLVFGCVDMILTPEGRYVFLEINPEGQWIWVQELTKLPLLANFAAMLAQGTLNYDCGDEMSTISATTGAEVVGAVRKEA